VDDDERGARSGGGYSRDEVEDFGQALCGQQPRVDALTE